MIEARNLSKRYGETLAVEDLSFIVEAGQVTGFLGPNGSGKSTNTRMIVGPDTPTSETVRVGGRTYESIHFPLHEVGTLLDADAAHPGRRARNHLNFLAELSLGMGQRLSIDDSFHRARPCPRRRTSQNRLQPRYGRAPHEGESAASSP